MPTVTKSPRRAIPGYPASKAPFGLGDRNHRSTVTNSVPPGVLVPNGDSPWSAEDDELLRRRYGLGKASATAAINELKLRHPDWTRRKIAARARGLGLSSTDGGRQQLWDRGADFALLSLVHQPKEVVARRLGRTTGSVCARLRRLGKSADFFGGFKSKDLADLLNVTEADVRRWQRHGWIQRRRGRITEASLSSLCKSHPDEISFTTLSPETQYWLIAVHGYPGEEPRAGTVNSST